MIIVNLVVIFQDDQTHFECSNNLKEKKTNLKFSIFKNILVIAANLESYFPLSKK